MLLITLILNSWVLLKTVLIYFGYFICLIILFHINIYLLVRIKTFWLIFESLFCRISYCATIDNQFIRFRLSLMTLLQIKLISLTQSHNSNWKKLMFLYLILSIMSLLWFWVNLPDNNSHIGCCGWDVSGWPLWLDFLVTDRN